MRSFESTSIDGGIRSQIKKFREHDKKVGTIHLAQIYDEFIEENSKFKPELINLVCKYALPYNGNRIVAAPLSRKDGEDVTALLKSALLRISAILEETEIIILNKTEK